MARHSLLLLLFAVTSTNAFTTVPGILSLKQIPAVSISSAAIPSLRRTRKSSASATSLRAQLDNENTQTAVGVGGLIASVVMIYSEYVLKTTGCGLPAGPGGSVGAIEGISYLYVVGLVAFSLYTKVKTGKGLPAGPSGLLGAAEGMGFLACLIGIVVLGFQLTDFGYVPNAVPAEGGKCS